MDFEGFLLDILDGAAAFDFNLLIRSFLISIVVIWFFITLWVWIDSGERTRNIPFRIFSVLLVAPLNIVGLIIYLLMRPKETIETVYWGDLERRYLLYETSELDDCENCGYQLQPGFNACPQCAFPIKNECRNCNVMIDIDWQYCPFCSHRQSHTVEESSQITKEEIEERVEETREQILSHVEKKGTRYKSSQGVTEKLGNYVIRQVMRVGEKINNVITGVPSAVSNGVNSAKKNAGSLNKSVGKKRESVDSKKESTKDASTKVDTNTDEESKKKNDSKNAPTSEKNLNENKES